MLGELATVPRALILDVGGFTADYLLLKNGRADLSTCDSLENGVILLYNRIRSKASSDLDILLEETDVDAILLQGQGSSYGEEVAALVEYQTQEFVNDMLGALRERQLDLRTGRVIFVGGGACLLAAAGGEGKYQNQAGQNCCNSFHTQISLLLSALSPKPY